MLPRDCDGGLIDWHKYFKNDHVLADHTPDYPGPCEMCVDVAQAHDDQIMSLCDEPDNCARIARDVSDCANRLRAIADKYGPNSIMQRYNVGVLVAVSEQLETM